MARTWTFSAGAALLLALNTSPPAAPFPSAPRGLNHQPISASILFERNVGQTDARVDFLARGRDYTLFLAGGDAVLAVDAPAARHSVRLTFVGASSPAAEPLDRQAARINYYRGADRSTWREHVPAFGRIRYAQIYPGVDLVYYGRRHRLEFDLTVAPGADPSQVTLRVDGAQAIHLDAAGDLVLNVGGGEVRQQRPIAYQETDGIRTPVSASYAVRGREVRLVLGPYDAGRALTIDPVILYSTYLGGPNASGFIGETANGIAADALGRAYVVGSTTSLAFPVSAGAYQAESGGGSDVTVACFSPDGSTLLYSTYLGGTGDDTGSGIAIDGDGNAHLTGQAAAGFPAVGAYQVTFGGGASDAFVATLDSGGTLVYSTYLGGTNVDRGESIAIDPAGHVYVVGTTASADFPTSAGAFDVVLGPPGDAFVAKFDPLAGGATSLVYSTFLGGSGNESSFAQSGIAVDAAGNAYVAGRTTSLDFPVTAGAYRTTCATCADGWFNEHIFVATLNATGSSLLYSTYFGGSGRDNPGAIALDAAGDVYFTGVVWSPDFPTTPGTVQPVYLGGPYVSADSGATWAVHNAGLKASSVNAFAVLEGTPAVLVAGTGVGIFRSLDNGVTWQDVNSNFSPETRFGALAVATSPSNSDVVYAGMNSGSVVKSVDRGATWTWMGSAGSGLLVNWVNQVAVDPSNALIVYAGGRGLNGGVYRSTNGGLNWTQQNTSLPANPNVDAMAMAPGASNVFYVALAAPGGSQLFASTDATATWSPISGVGRTVAAITVSPDNPNVVYLGTVGGGVFMTTDGGGTWTAKNVGMGGSNVSALATDRTEPDTLYAASNRGIHKSVDGAESWTLAGTGVVNLQTSSVYIDPNDHTRIHAGSADGAKAFVAKLHPAGAGAADLVYSTFVGGTIEERGWSIAVDATGHAHVAGETLSGDFPEVAPLQPCANGASRNAFAAALNPSATGYVFASCLGGHLSQSARGMALGAGSIYVTGTTTSNDFPLVAAYQSTYAGGGDAFVVRLSAGNTPVGSHVSVTPPLPTGAPSPITVTFDAVTAAGNTTATATAGPPPPSGFSVGEPPVYYEITTTASYTPPVEVCISYAGVSFGGGTPRLFHFESDAWADVTTSVDVGAQVVCGSVSALSPFALFVNLPPVLHVSASPSTIWPPNGRMVAIVVAVSASGAGGTPAVKLVSITANEPLGTGDVQGAVVGSDDRTFLLRAARLGRGTGRAYTITYSATDTFGATTTATTEVVVPHDMRR